MGSARLPQCVCASCQDTARRYTAASGGPLWRQCAWSLLVLAGVLATSWYIGVSVQRTTTLVTTLAVLAFVRLIVFKLDQGPLIERAEKKREQRDGLIQQFKEKYGFELTSEESELIKLTACELLERLDKGTLTSHAITLAFCKRALAVDSDLHCLADVPVTEALAAAEQADKRRARMAKEGKPNRPLEGLPVSVKDQFTQRGCDSTCGQMTKTLCPKPEDGLLVSLLRDAGAIPFVRTATPQCLMLPSCDSVTWGCGANPWKHTHTPGGSSGGEGALIGSCGSPLGFGTDIGGSIRIPAHFCGIAGFKPTPMRTTLMGLEPMASRSGVHVIRPTAGPLARSVDDLTLMLKALWVDRMHVEDPYVAYKPFDDKEYKSTQPLTIGWFDEDCWFTPCSASRRAVQMARETLEARGHTLVKLPTHQCRDIMLTYLAVILGDGSQGFVDLLEGEAIHPDYMQGRITSLIPSLLRPFVVALLHALGQSRLASVCQIVGAKSAQQFWDWTNHVTHLQHLFADVMREHSVEALVCPAGALPALPFDSVKHLVGSFSYTTMFNLLHFPSGVVPATCVTKQDAAEAYTDTYFGADKLVRSVRAMLPTTEGLPIGVQVAALPMEDEKALRLLAELEASLAFPGVPFVQMQTKK